jgi:hypothetical protein
MGNNCSISSKYNYKNKFKEKWDKKMLKNNKDIKLLSYINFSILCETC